MDEMRTGYGLFSGNMLMGLCSHLLNEIMPMIYKRFTDKASEEWRQIYKASPWSTCNRQGLRYSVIYCTRAVAGIFAESDL